MKLLQKKTGRFPLGIWIAMGALILSLIAWIMQAYSLWNWEGAVHLGLQNSSFLGSASEVAWATKERGEAIADLVWPFPISLVAIIGLWKGKFVGFVASMMEFAICVYFPLFYLFQILDAHPETVLAAMLLWGIPSVLGIVGLWANRNIFLNDLK